MYFNNISPCCLPWKNNAIALNSTQYNSSSNTVWRSQNFSFCPQTFFKFLHLWKRKRSAHEGLFCFLSRGFLSFKFPHTKDFCLWKLTKLYQCLNMQYAFGAQMTLQTFLISFNLTTWKIFVWHLQTRDFCNFPYSVCEIQSLKENNFDNYQTPFKDRNLGIRQLHMIGCVSTKSCFE